MLKITFFLLIFCLLSCGNYGPLITNEEYKADLLKQKNEDDCIMIKSKNE